MKLIIAGLFLTLAVFLNSIELSSQSGRPEKKHGGYRPGAGRKSRMLLPYPYYYVTTDLDSEIRSSEHPNAHEVRTKDGVFQGMTENDGLNFYPITLPNGQVVTINLKERYTNYLSPEEVRELRRNIPLGAGPSGTSFSQRRSQSPGRGSG